MCNYKVLAIDFGASSGRAIIGNFKNNKIELEEIHRFSNDPVKLNKTLYWDFLRLVFEIKQSIIKSKKYGEIKSMAIDTWGVDFGLIDKFGNLIQNPIHYRDERTNHILEKVFEKIDKNLLYKITGNQIMHINTAFQLFALKNENPEIFEKVDKILLMPDLFNYFFTGEKKSEISIASTTQLFDMNKKEWAKEIFEKLELDYKFFPSIIKSGEILAPIKKDIQEELNIHKFNIISISSHDTQSAVVAVPTQEENFVFLSCGTWSLMGTELEKPIINEKSSQYNITNEIGYENKVIFLKNIIGLWLIQESKRQWEKEGKEYNFSEIEKMAEIAEPFKFFINPDDEIFVSSGNMPQKIKKYCQEKFGEIPENIGEIARAINESLAFKYKRSLMEIENCTGKKYDKIYMIGGGVQSKMLCQMTANACGCTVFAGAKEATVFGNVAIQLIANGKIKNLKEARKIIKDSEEIKIYKPKDTEIWQKNYEKFKKLIF